MTTRDQAGQIFGCTANSFSSVSLKPPLVLWSQALTAGSYAAFQNSERFVVNILSEEQRPLSQQFATSMENKFNGVNWEPGISGLPILTGCSAYLECRKVANYPGGDHTIFLGEVESLQRAKHRPLVFSGGKYMLAFPHEFGLSSGTPGIAHIEAVRIANTVLPDICTRMEHSVCLSVWGNRGPTIIRFEHHANPIADQMSAGLVLSTLYTPTGQVFLAYLPRERVQAVLDDELAKHQSLGLKSPSPEKIDGLVADVRSRGLAKFTGSHAPSLGEIDVAAFAAPVFDRTGAIALVISAMARISEVGSDWTGPLPTALVAEAAALSRRLGYQAPAAPA